MSYLLWVLGSHLKVKQWNLSIDDSVRKIINSAVVSFEDNFSSFRRFKMYYRNKYLGHLEVQ